MKGLRVSVVTLVVLVVAVFIAACSSKEEAAPQRSVVPPGAVDTGDAGGDGGDNAPVDPSCLGKDGCYSCEPKKSLDFLNACTDGQCVPFDNGSRLPLFQAGKPLPAIP